MQAVLNELKKGRSTKPVQRGLGQAKAWGKKSRAQIQRGHGLIYLSRLPGGTKQNYFPIVNLARRYGELSGLFET